MGSAVFLYRDYVVTGILSGGNWLTSLPLSNAQNADLGIVARSADATLSATKFKIDIGAMKLVGGAVVGPTNLSPGASYRMRAFSDPGGYAHADASVPVGGIAASATFPSGPYTREGKTVSANDEWTFARSTAATYFDDAGVLQTAAANAARFDYDPAGPFNEVLYSDQINNAGFWGATNLVVTANAAVGPDGAQLACKISENSSSAAHYLLQSSLFAADDASASVYVKPAGRSKFAFQQYDGATTYGMVFDLVSGTVTPWGSGAISGSITSLSNGWFRCQTRIHTGAGSGNIGIILYNGSATTYVGDGVSGIYVAGFQLQRGTTATAYIPTTNKRRTTAFRGMLLETPSNNYIQYNQSQGAVAGSPGTAPNSWTINTPPGCTRTIATGVEDGIEYVDITVSGTATSGSFFGVYFPGFAPAIAGSDVILSAYIKRVAGTSFGNLAGYGNSLVFRIYQAGMDFDEQLPVAVSGRLSNARQSKKSVAAFSSGASGLIYFNVPVGDTLNFTLRIGLPQLEFGTVPSSAIKTAGVVEYRATDVVTLKALATNNWSVISESGATQNVADVVGDLTLTAFNLNSHWIKSYQAVRSAFPYLVYDTGIAIVQGGVIDWSVPASWLEWENPDFWTGFIDEDDTLNFPLYLGIVFPADIFAQYFLIEMFDEQSSDGYVEFGRAMVCRAWRPSVNYAPGSNSFGIDVNTDVQQSIDGNRSYWEHLQRRVLSLTFPSLTEDEIFASVFAMGNSSGTSRQVFVMPNPDDGFRSRKRNFLATFKQAPAIAQLNVKRGSTMLQFEEVL